MHDHSQTKKQEGPGAGSPKICLVGNPNVGKSAIFGLLTGRYVTVSNYPGTTVEMISGETTFHREKYEIIDTPGVNSLVPMSEDEKVTRDVLLETDLRSIIQVIDTKNIRRGLLITLQLAEMGLPFVVDLNMGDEASDRGISVNEAVLEDILGVKVVSTVAVKKKGITGLKKHASKASVSGYSFTYSPNLEGYISEIEAVLPHSRISRRSIALMILSGDMTLRQWLLKNLNADDIGLIESIRDRASEKYMDPLSLVISRQRLSIVDSITDRVMSRSAPQRGGVARFLGEITIHPVWGFPFLFLVLYVLYQFVGSFGAGTLVDYLEEVVFPITTTFFIAFSIMEDSGYLPRLASMLNRVFRAMGLNGKAVLPMVLGLGCDTMATLTTRILDTPKERLIVIILLALGVPCSAQLGVILGMFGKQPFSALLIWIAALTIVILFVGFLSARLIPGQRADFILELPPIRMPQISNVLVKTMGRIEWYLKEAVPLFILGTLILFIADKIRILPMLQDLASPVIVTVLGLPAKATESFIIGFLRRDYGAAGLFTLQEQGLLNTEQTVVSLVTITLFIPCIANLFMIIKERGVKTALLIAVFIFPFAILVGGVLHRLLLWFNVFP
jgi:ferrous iron transport protein B